MTRPSHKCEEWPTCDCVGHCEIRRILLSPKRADRVEKILIAALIALAVFGVLALTDALPSELIR